MNWTDDIELKLMQLWHQSEKKTEKKMMTKKAQHKWVAQKLVAYGEEKGMDVEGLTDIVVKNKLASIRKKGKSLVQKHIKPLAGSTGNKLPTGSAAEEDGSPSDPLANFDWSTLEKKVKWANLRHYWELFGLHPTWGIWPVVETTSDI